MALLGESDVTLIKKAGTPEERRLAIRGTVMPKKGVFPKDTPIYEGDTIEVPDPRGGLRRVEVASVKVHAYGSALDHIEVEWGKPRIEKTAAIRRLGLEGLHPAVLKAAGDLFTDGHYADAIFNAFKLIEVTVRDRSGLDLSGQDLMAKAFKEDAPRISVAVESGQSGKDEQRGFMFLFMGAIVGIRNPKGHGFVEQKDPQRALEYLAFASLLMRRLDDAAGQG